MALPAVRVSDSVIYWPFIYDATAMPSGYSEPVAAIITKVNPEDQTVDLVIFPPGLPPANRLHVKYYADATGGASSFRILSDTDPACGSSKSGVSVTDTQATHFVIEWTNPVDYALTQILYKVNGTTTYLTPNISGNASGVLGGSGTTFTFTAGIVDGTTYDVKVRNMCENGIFDAGVIVTATATTPL